MAASSIFKLGLNLQGTAMLSRKWGGCMSQTCSQHGAPPKRREKAVNATNVRITPSSMLIWSVKLCQSCGLSS